MVVKYVATADESDYLNDADNISIINVVLDIALAEQGTVLAGWHL